MSHKVILFEEKRPDIKISIVAYFLDNGDLRIDGYDIGISVEEYMGDSDYEYQATVTAENIEKLCNALKISTKDELLATIAARFNDNFCFSNFLKFLESENIPHSTFYWR